MLSLLLALTLAAPPKPKPAGWLAVEVACTDLTTLACTLTGSWSLPPTWRAGDSLKVVWSQTSPTSASNLRTRYSRGTADTMTLTRAEGKAYAGKLCVTTLRPGTTVVATACVNWSAPTVPVTPPDTVGGLKVASLVAFPPAVSLTGGQSQLVCFGAVLEDGSKSRVVPWPAACEPKYLAWVATG